jgi:hypothetical protein
MYLLPSPLVLYRLLSPLLPHQLLSPLTSSTQCFKSLFGRVEVTGTEMVASKRVSNVEVFAKLQMAMTISTGTIDRVKGIIESPIRDYIATERAKE